MKIKPLTIIHGALTINPGLEGLLYLARLNGLSEPPTIQKADYLEWRDEEGNTCSFKRTKAGIEYNCSYKEGKELKRLSFKVEIK